MGTAGKRTPTLHTSVVEACTIQKETQDAPSARLRADDTAPSESTVFAKPRHRSNVG